MINIGLDEGREWAIKILLETLKISGLKVRLIIVYAFIYKEHINRPEMGRNAFALRNIVSVLTILFSITIVTNSSEVYSQELGENTKQLTAKWGTPGSNDMQFSNPAGIAVDSLGNVYVADTDNNRVQKFDGNGM